LSNSECEVWNAKISDYWRCRLHRESFGRTPIAYRSGVAGYRQFRCLLSRDEKLANISQYVSSGRIALVHADILDENTFEGICLEGFDAIVHLAALAGVRPWLARPVAYQQVNFVGTTRLLELAKHWSIPRFVFASSSSVHGNHPAALGPNHLRISHRSARMRRVSLLPSSWDERILVSTG
jgi:nucleoside-diphosphate-sugar epimerase